MAEPIKITKTDSIEMPENDAPETPASGFGRLYSKSTGLYFKGDDGVELLVSGKRGIGIIIDGSGSTITTGVKGYIEIPFNCVIERVTMLADQSGSIVVDIWKDTYANYPPVDADSITASAVPTISSATKSQDSTLSGWTTTINEGDILGFNVDSATSIQRLTLSLKVRPT